MMHPATRIAQISASVGEGVRATAAIPRGTVVWARGADDLVMTVDDLGDLASDRRAWVIRYGYRDHRGRMIVCADAGRYINHSCEPSLRGVGHDAQIAVRDIRPGDEITCDYAECNLVEPLDCACASRQCRGRVRPDDLLRYAARWDVEVAEALALASTVAQPVVAHALNGAALRAVLDLRVEPISLREVAYAGR